MVTGLWELLRRARRRPSTTAIGASERGYRRPLPRAPMVRLHRSRLAVGPAVLDHVGEHVVLS